MFSKKNRPDARRGSNEVKRCSFCHKAEVEVAKLIAGPSVYICDECVRVCTALIAERGGLTDEGSPAELSSTGGERTAFCAFCGRPIERREGVPVPEQGAYCQACAADDSKPGA